MKKDQRVWPTAKAPPAGWTAQTVAEVLGWSVPRLLQAIELGQLPAPNVFGGLYHFPLTYTLDVKCNGLRLPGTFPGLPPHGSALPEGAKARHRRARADSARSRMACKKRAAQYGKEGGAK